MPVDEIADIDLGTSEKTFAELDRAAAQAIKVLEQRNKELKTSLSNAAKAKNETNRLNNRGGIYANEESDEPIKSGDSPYTPITKEEVKLAKEEEKLKEKQEKRELKDSGKQEYERLQNRGGIYAESDELTPKGSAAPGDIARDVKTLDDIIDSKTKQATDKLKKEIFGDEIGFETITNMIAMGKNPAGFMLKTMKSFKSIFVPLIAVFAAVEITRQILQEIKKIDTFFKKYFDRVNERVDKFNSLDEQANIRAGLTQRIITTASGSKEPRYEYNTFNEFNDNLVELESKFQLNNNSGG